MKYCNRCLYPENHPLNITFDDKGVCSGCRVHEEKDTLDWHGRSKKLKKIFDAYKSPSGKFHDCIIPVNGARDSYFIVHTVKNIYGMNPLLVTYNKHYNTNLGIRNLAYLRTLLGCDILNFTVSPSTAKKITRVTLREFASIYWHCLAGETVFPVQTAVRFKIPLIVWGVHQGCDQVGMFSHLDEVEMTRKYRKEHDLMGHESQDILKLDSSILNEGDTTPFEYPHDKELEKAGVRGIYLSNYIRWDSKKQHEDMIKLYGYETRAQHRTFDTYNDTDSFIYSDLHDYIKYLKHGYGKAVDHASREIRLKRLTRDEGIALASKYENIPPSPLGVSLFCEWLGISEKDLWFFLEQKRNLKIWEKNSSGDWRISDHIQNHKIEKDIKANALTKKENCEFQITPSKNPLEQENKYVLVARGFRDR
ncbi:LPS biosynthesis protein [Candidatus Omnitrophus magneticus]|uniref:LPS biosynthesis protein n=1 Tax=Candidatus Omnitrophus magneticus TaxID=1609969 RepID=A0A0F0CQ27_9BACT|nr:LPS biosynthesis protein [Candidatus Omnitrophus magneticus]